MNANKDQGTAEERKALEALVERYWELIHIPNNPTMLGTRNRTLRREAWKILGRQRNHLLCGAYLEVNRRRPRPVKPVEETIEEAVDWATEGF